LITDCILLLVFLVQRKLWLLRWPRRTLIRDLSTLHSKISERFQQRLLRRWLLKLTSLVSLFFLLRFFLLQSAHMHLLDPIVYIRTSILPYVGLATRVPPPRDLVKHAESCMYSPAYRSYRWSDGSFSSLASELQISPRLRKRKVHFQYNNQLGFHLFFVLLFFC